MISPRNGSIYYDTNGESPLDENNLSAPLISDDEVAEGQAIQQDSDDSNEAETSHEVGWGPTLAGIAGNILEWYDFALFGYFGDVIGDVFFPKDQPGHMAIVESFAVFGGAFLMRPIGGVIMGYIGDKSGNRKLALTASIFLMAFPTFLMGCLPSYNKAGYFAIIALILVRLLQGLSVGGQLMSSLVFTLENHPYEHWGFYGSVVMASANFGTLLGGIAGFTIRASLNDHQVHTWGWRVPFLMGVFVSASGFYLRSYSDEHNPQEHQQQVQEEQQHLNQNEATSAAVSSEPSAGTDTTTADIATEAITTNTVTDEQVEENSNPLRTAFKPSNLRSLLAAAMVPTLWSGGFYLSFVWMPIFMTDLIDTPIKASFAVNSTALLLSVCFFFCYAGHLSDIYGRKFIMTIGSVSTGIFTPIVLYIIGNYSKGNPWIALFAQIFLGLILTLYGSPMLAWLGESFHPEARLTSVAIGYNIAQAVAGGSAPSLATVLVDKYGTTSPGYIITVLSVISLIGLWIVAPQQKPSQEPPQQPDAVIEEEEVVVQPDTVFV